METPVPSADPAKADDGARGPRHALVFGASGDIPDVIDAATDLPAEAWQGDYYDDEEIKTIVDHVREILDKEAPELTERAEVLTLQLMEWVLTTVSTVDVIVDELN